ncbi:Translation initiation factor 1A [Coemansia sp. RSA 486]|nr:Translation initiation factor 1A [Coemansia sp. RSA 486]
MNFGGKTRRRGKNDTEGEKRELVFKGDDQEYAYVTKLLGNGRLSAISIKGEKLRVHIRGKMRKKVWIAVGNLVLVSEREFETVKEDTDRNVDLLIRYNDEEESQLRKYGEIPDVRPKTDEGAAEEGDDADIEFNRDLEADDDSDSDNNNNIRDDDFDIDDI